METHFFLLKNTVKSGQSKSKMVKILELHAAKRRQRALQDFDNALSRR